MLKDHGTQLMDKLIEYNQYFHSHSKYPKYVRITMLFAWLIHFAMTVVFLANTYKAFGWESLECLTEIPIIKDIPALIPFYGNTWYDAIILAIVSAWVIPIIFSKKIIKLISKNCFDKTPAPAMSKDLMFAYQEINERSKFDEFNLGCGLFISEMLFAFILGICGKSAVATFILCIITLIISGVYSVCAQMDDTEYQTTYKKFSEMKEKIEKYKEQRKKDEINAAEAKRKQKAERERKERQAKAEAEFKELTIDGNKDYNVIEQLAENGSPSACIYICKKIFIRTTEEKLTKSEKSKLIKKAIGYAKIAAKEGFVDGEFLLLSFEVIDGSYTKNEFEQKLAAARRIRKNENFDESLFEACDILIDGLIAMIDKMENAPAPTPTYPTGGASYYPAPPIPEHIYCWYWDGGFCTKGSLKRCNGWCPEYHSHVESCQKEHEKYMAYLSNRPY